MRGDGVDYEVAVGFNAENHTGEVETMNEEGVDKIAEAIAAKLAEEGANQPLGCGSASNPGNYGCTTQYDCAGSSYECGGAGRFNCMDWFDCHSGTTFSCDSRFECSVTFYCEGTYST